MRGVKLRKFALGLAAGSVALVVGAAAFTGRASAVSCSQIWVCFYVNSNYGGSSYLHYSPVTNVCYGLPAAYNDTFSSVYNNIGGVRLFMYREAGCNTIPFVVFPVEGVPSFNWTWNDTISSYKVAP